MRTNIEALESTPICRFTSGGNETQRHYYIVEGVRIVEETYFPYNWFKKITVRYYVDLIFAMDYVVEDGEMSDAGYFEEGFGQPMFDSLEKAVMFIENYKI
jgi:hypothetical protein